MAEKLLEVKDLTLSFETAHGSVQAVRGLSFDLYEGETLALVGESGAGKTAAGRAVMGLSAANARILGGTIRFRGQELLSLREEEMARLRGKKIAMIFQDPFSSLDPIMRIGAQLTEAIAAGQKKGPRAGRLGAAQIREKALRLLSDVGIDDAARRFEQYPFELSGGMRQRIVIAIALSQDPELLICDEPTTALDVTIQAQILELLQKIRRERSLAVLFITHSLGVVAELADRVAVMYAGRLCEIGTVREIFYEAVHPYTWALLHALPDADAGKKLTPIPGLPPDMSAPPAGDAFAARNPFALPADFEKQPPLYSLSETHKAAAWLLDVSQPLPETLPEALRTRLEQARKRSEDNRKQEIAQKDPEMNSETR